MASESQIILNPEIGASDMNRHYLANGTDEDHNQQGNGTQSRNLTMKIKNLMNTLHQQTLTVQQTQHLYQLHHRHQSAEDAHSDRDEQTCSTYRPTRPRSYADTNNEEGLEDSNGCNDDLGKTVKDLTNAATKNRQKAMISLNRSIEHRLRIRGLTERCDNLTGDVAEQLEITASGGQNTEMNDDVLSPETIARTQFYIDQELRRRIELQEDSDGNTSDSDHTRPERDINCDDSDETSDCESECGCQSFERNSHYLPLPCNFTSSLTSIRPRDMLNFRLEMYRRRIAEATKIQDQITNISEEIGVNYQMSEPDSSSISNGMDVDETNSTDSNKTFKTEDLDLTPEEQYLVNRL